MCGRCMKHVVEPRRTGSRSAISMGRHALAGFAKWIARLDDWLDAARSIPSRNGGGCRERRDGRIIKAAQVNRRSLSPDLVVR